MRFCVIAFAIAALAQPALAAPSHKTKPQITNKDHAQTHHRGAYRKVVRAPRVRETPIISGYAMPKTFEEADAMGSRYAGAPAAPYRAAPMVSQPVSAFTPYAQPRVVRARAVRNTALDGAIARHAAANGLPVELVHRVVKRESNYNPRASSKGNIGLMQIRYQTARGVGYTGSAAGLLDAETNLTYAVKYLKGAYQAAGGNHSRAVALYASGYHGRGVAVARRAPVVVADATPAWGAQASAQGAWAASDAGPGWGVQTAPVSMREDAMRVYELRKRRARR